MSSKSKAFAISGLFILWLQAASVSATFPTLRPSFAPNAPSFAPNAPSFAPNAPSVAPTTIPYVMNTVVGGGDGDSLTTGIPALNSVLNNPSGLWKDSTGVIFFTELYNFCARKIDLSGFIQNVAGTCGTSGASGDGGAATLSGLLYPTNIVTDTTGVVYISDQSQYKIRKVLLDGTLWTFAGNGGDGFTTGLQATSVGIGKPNALWINPAGEVFYSTFTSNIVYLNMITTDGIIARYAGASGNTYADGFAATSTRIADIAFLVGDYKGRLLFGDGGSTHGRHVKAISANRVVSTVMGNGVKDYSGEGTQATATALLNPNGIAIDESTGDVFVSLYDGNRVQKLTNSTGLVYTFAGNGGGEEGVEGGDATSGAVVGPHALLFDSNGLYVVDSGFAKIRLVHHPYPSVQPSQSPTVVPTTLPSESPTLAPTTLTPTVVPVSVSPVSGKPSLSPTIKPSAVPTKFPTAKPTKTPTKGPTTKPTRVPSIRPTSAPPSDAPTQTPSETPSEYPTEVPSLEPSENPTLNPTGSPTFYPTIGTTHVTPTSGGGSSCYWAEEEDSCGGDLQEVVVSTNAVTRSANGNTTTTITRKYRKRS